MSYKVHAVLVGSHDFWFDGEDGPEEMEEAAREAAKDYTDSYKGAVFDRREPTYSSDRTEADPDSGVVLGMNEPDRFVRLLREWMEAPKRECEYHLGYWQGATSAMSMPGVHDWDFVEKWWWPAEPGMTDLHHLKILVEILAGEYLFESGFYSAPDGSPKISQEILADATENPGNYALVFWVYHI